jgi:hypothetical protein
VAWRSGLAALAALACLLCGSLAAHAAGDTGTRDFSFSASGVSAPTGQKPQSKLWFNDGIWWGDFFRTSTDDFEIFRFNTSTDSWAPTGVALDNRNATHADTLWDGTHLYVASAGKDPTKSGDSARLYRYSYDSGSATYTRDTGFPVTVVNGGMEALVLARDGAGKLWITYTRSNAVYVAHTAGDDRTWGSPYVLPVPGAGNLTADDISSIVAYDSKIGIIWSNQTDLVTYVATHADNAPDDQWSVAHALDAGGVTGKEAEVVDDHLNVKALSGDPAGRVFVASKTSLDLSGDPLIMLLVMKPDGTWNHYTVWQVKDSVTRPIVMIDQEHRDLYVLGSAGPCCNGGAIFYKKTSLDHPSFAPGLGTPLIQNGTDTHVNNVTSTKQNLSSATGLLVAAGDDTTKYYLHKYTSLAIGDVTPPETTIDSGPEAVVTSPNASFAFSSSEPGATFECSLDGAPFGGCTPPRAYTSLPSGSHVFQVRATDAAGNTDPTPASRSWTVTDSSTPLFSDGFESSDLSAWQTVTGGDGQAGVQSSVVKSGSYAARLSETANTGSVAYARRSLSSAQTGLTVSGDFDVLAQASGTTGNVPLLRLYDQAGTRLVSVFRQNGTSNKLYVAYGGSNYLTSGLLPLGTWARLSVRLVTAGSGASTVEVRVNEVLVHGSTTASLGTAGVSTLQIGNDTKQQTFTLVADNISAQLSG